MSKLKPGDRVRLKGFGEVGGESSNVEGAKATIVRNEFAGTFVVKADNKDWEVRVFPSQCVRLKKRERREWWFKTHESACKSLSMQIIFYDTKREAENSLCHSYMPEMAHVREVVRKREGGKL